MARSKVMTTRKRDLAHSWFYPYVIAAVSASTERPYYRQPGPGLTKAEVMDAIRQAGAGLSRPPLAEVTIATHVKQLAQLGLLDRSGHGVTTRYWPPGYLKRARREERLTAAQYLKEVLLEP